MIQWLGRHLPRLPDVDPETERARRDEAQEAKQQSRRDLVGAVEYRQGVREVGRNVDEVLSRNHLAPAFELAMQRRPQP